MLKKDRTLIIIFVAALIILIPLYGIVANYKNSEKVTITYPEGGLSDSLFVSQNNAYTKNEAFPDAHELSQVPYLIDLPSGSAATVGNSRIIKANSTIYVYVSEHNSSKSAESLFLEEFPGAIMMNYSPLYTYTQAVKSQKGYINGFGAEYSFYILTVSDGTNVIPVYAALYDLTMPDETYEGHITVSVITTAQSTENFDYIKQVLDDITGTVRFDESLKKKIDKRTEAEGEPLKTETSTQTEPEVNTYAPEREGHTILIGKPETLINEDDIDARVAEITMEGPFENGYITITSTVPCGLSVITLYDDNYEEMTEKEVTPDGLMTTFHVGDIPVGTTNTYTIKITHYSEIGTISLEKGEL